MRGEAIPKDLICIKLPWNLHGENIKKPRIHASFLTMNNSLDSAVQPPRNFGPDLPGEMEDMSSRSPQGITVDINRALDGTLDIDASTFPLYQRPSPSKSPYWDQWIDFRETPPPLVLNDVAITTALRKFSQRPNTYEDEMGYSELITGLDPRCDKCKILIFALDMKARSLDPKLTQSVNWKPFSFLIESCIDLCNENPEFAVQLAVSVAEILYWEKRYTEAETLFATAYPELKNYTFNRRQLDSQAVAAVYADCLVSLGKKNAAETVMMDALEDHHVKAWTGVHLDLYKGLDKPICPCLNSKAPGAMGVQTQRFKSDIRLETAKICAMQLLTSVTILGVAKKLGISRFTNLKRSFDDVFLGERMVY